ncbi:MAG: hypothetical protein J7K84_00255 [Deltaproteobacteria bacterium]|nr:hypothetical protein [Deltaproteobacteria bacterium]
MKDEKTYRIIGAAMGVHKELGSGFLEVGLLINFGSKSLEYKRLVYTH